MTKLLMAAIALVALSTTACWGVTAAWEQYTGPIFWVYPGVDGVAAGTVTATPAGTVATETPTVEPSPTPIPDTPTPLATFFVIDQGGCAVALPSSGVAPWWFALVPIAFLWIRTPAVRWRTDPRRAKPPVKRRERRGGG